MSNQSLAEQVKNDIQSLQSSLRDLQSSVRMTDIRDSGGFGYICQRDGSADRILA